MRILIVEDNTATAALLIRLIWKLGHTSQTAATIALAVEAAAISKFDVALVDLELPDGDGASLSQTLKEKDIKCIALSRDHQAVHGPEMACFTACLKKPIDFGDLSAVLNACQLPPP
jgi:DNA-binding response OmpR family regulator